MSRAVSLHIGVNECDPAHYAGWTGKLEGPENDCITMTEITGNAGFDCRQLKTRDATRQNVIDTIKEIAGELQYGDTFVISYAGHGNSHADKSRDEQDGYDETWCLYDGEFFDDELGGLFTMFAEGVEIIGFFDCCHSATMTHDKSMSHTTSGDNRSSSPAVVSDARSLQAGELVREMPGDLSERLRSENSEVYKVIKMSSLAQIKDPVKACVLVFSGCDDGEKSKERGGHGLFTQALKAVWSDGQFAGDYKQFRQDIVAQLPATQTPQLSFIGDVEVLMKQRPFSLSYGLGNLPSLH